MSKEPPSLYEPRQAESLGLRHPVLLLSASVPVPGRDPRYLPARRTEIRTAVVQLARFAFARDVQLVFGGHPAISPIVLGTTRTVEPSSEPRVFVFQSDYFRDVIPDDTEKLADWTHGRLLWTRSAGPRQAPHGPSRPVAREQSLGIMREAMLGVPGLVGAVFIGGMEGVEDESRLWRRQHPDLPRYALPSTGGAARCLFTTEPRAFGGTLADPSVLDTRVFPRALAEIFADLGMP